MGSNCLRERLEMTAPAVTSPAVLKLAQLVLLVAALFSPADPGFMAAAVASDEARSVFASEELRAGVPTAPRFGIYEVTFRGGVSTGNPFDVAVTVTFVPPSGVAQSKTVRAFFDGNATWRARVYVSEAGLWNWTSACPSDADLHAQTGKFYGAESTLPGRLLPHPQNPRHWITENGRPFLNISDTAYFLLSEFDGNGDPVSDEIAEQYIADDVQQGITSIRCFVASGPGGFTESPEQWERWYFADQHHDMLRLENLQCADRRLRMLLDRHPEVVVQLILTPLEGYGRDQQFWSSLSTMQRERLLHNLLARFAAYPQLMWLITNDAHYGDRFPRNNAMAREIGAWLQRHDLWNHPRSTGHARTLPFALGQDDWVDYIHIEHKYDLGAQQYERYHELQKPVFLGEDRYEQDHGPSQDPSEMRYWQRRLFWTWLLSGGSANYGGRWWTVHPYHQTGTLPAVYYKRAAQRFTARLTGLDSVSWIRPWFDARSIDLAQFTPDHALVRDRRSTDPVRAPRLMRREWQEFLIYHPQAADDGQHARADATSAASMTINLSQAHGAFAVEWYRVSDGVSAPGEAVEGGQQVSLTAPWQGHDVMLRLWRTVVHEPSPEIW